MQQMEEASGRRCTMLHLQQMAALYPGAVVVKESSYGMLAGLSASSKIFVEVRCMAPAEITYAPCIASKAVHRATEETADGRLRQLRWFLGSEVNLLFLL